MKWFTMTKTVARNLVEGPATLMYPKRERAFTIITRGKVENDIDNCIFCGICSKRCPTYAIEVTKESSEWEIDYLKCCTCNLCVEVCPKKCLSMHNHYFPPVTDKAMGIHRLQSTAPRPSGKGKAQGTKEESEKETAKKVVIDEPACVACGACVEVCPEVFSMEEGAKAAKVIKATGGPKDKIREAIDTCPTQCIKWEG